MSRIKVPGERICRFYRTFDVSLWVFGIALGFGRWWHFAISFGPFEIGAMADWKPTNGKPDVSSGID